MIALFNQYLIWGDAMLPDTSEPGSHRIYQELAIAKHIHDAYVRENESGGGESGGSSGASGASGVRQPPPLSGGR